MGTATAWGCRETKLRYTYRSKFDTHIEEINEKNEMSLANSKINDNQCRHSLSQKPTPPVAKADFPCRQSRHPLSGNGATHGHVYR